MTENCVDKKLRKWQIGDTDCNGDYKHCNRIVRFGKQEYCGFTPGRCGIHQVIRTQAGCLFCKYATKNLDCAKCLPCLSSETRINFEKIRE